MKKLFTNSILILSITLLLWIFGSFIEVNAKHDTPNPNYNNYNAFVVLLEVI